MKMRNRLHIVSAVLMMTLCAAAAAENRPESSPAVKLVETYAQAEGTRTRIVEGFLLKMARPIIKKTPAFALYDQIETIVLYQMEDMKEEDRSRFGSDLEASFGGYMKTGAVECPNSTMDIYINQSDDGTIDEIIMHVTEPKPTMMIFQGTFTLESILEMQALNDAQTKH